MSDGRERERPRAVLRAPNHLGELILALPALEAAVRRWPTPPLVQVVQHLTPVLRMSGLEAEVLALPGRRRVVRAALALRRRRPDVGVLLTPAFSAALIFALAGVRSRRGTDTDGRGWLLTEAVDRAPLLRRHRVREYLRLVDPGPAEDAPDGVAGDGPAGASDGGSGSSGGRAAGRAPPAPRLSRLGPAREAWRVFARREGLDAGGDPVVGLVPGGKAPARRWPPEKFHALAERLAARGSRVRVFGAPGEEGATARVAGGTAGVDDLGGRTDLFELTGGLLACDAVVGNDTGTIHLAAAVDRPVVVVWGSGSPRQTRPLATSVRLVGRFDLPCHPCLETSCPRRGPGYVADEARRECLTLVPVGEVEAAARRALRRGRTPGAAVPGGPGGRGRHA